MKNINVINKIKERIITLKPYKNEHGTKFKVLNSIDYLLYSIARNKKSPEKGFHKIEKFNEALIDLKSKLLYSVESKYKFDSNGINELSKEEIIELFNHINEAYNVK